MNFVQRDLRYGVPRVHYLQVTQLDTNLHETRDIRAFTLENNVDALDATSKMFCTEYKMEKSYVITPSNCGNLRQTEGSVTQYNTEGKYIQFRVRRGNIVLKVRSIRVVLNKFT